MWGWRWRVVLDSTSPTFRVLCVRERERSRRGESGEGGGCEGDGVGRLLMGCGVDIDGKDFL